MLLCTNEHLSSLTLNQVSTQCKGHSRHSVWNTCLETTSTIIYSIRYLMLIYNISYDKIRIHFSGLESCHDIDNGAHVL